jgi:ferredoxin-NADP reductase
VFLVAGGSGVVPLMAMLRHRRLAGSDAEMRLLLSAKGPDDVIYARELEVLGALTGVEVALTYTREAPPGWNGHRGRVDGDLLRAVGWPREQRPLIFACGPTGFVEAVADGLLALGHPADRIRTERFGATGG